MNNTLHVNLFGGPGTGKSTTSAGVFALMKKRGYKIEIITEYAKDLTYKEDFKALTNQLSLLAEQKTRHWVLENQVDYTITDSPFVMGLTYLRDDPHLPKDEFIRLAVAMYKTYNNLNIFLERDNDVHPYQEYGRSQTLEQSMEKDKEILTLLETHKIPFVKIKISENTEETIFNEITKGLKND